MMNKRIGHPEAESKTIPRPITYSFANPADKIQIRRLLSMCGLPTLYIHRHLKSFVMAKAGKKIAGVIGVQVYGRVGLLRSLCVDPVYRNQGIAKMLNERILAYAHRRKIDKLYMFTWDAEKFASKLGFHKINKKRIPKSIRSTWQFRYFSPYRVVCMTKEITKPLVSSPHHVIK
jgi:amino-acid N-acetyltransferase